jgi:UDP-glucose 4-epimerase
LIDEQHPTEPVTSYGIMKLAAEKYVLMHKRLYGLPVRILRCGNVYGEHQPATRSQGVVAVFLERIAAGNSIPLYGDGSIVRDFVYVGDLVELLLRSIAAPRGSSPLNIGSGKGYSLAQVVTEIESVVGRQAIIDRRPDRGYDVARVVLDISRVRREFGFEPLNLQEGLRRTVSAVHSGAAAAG